MLQRCCCRSAPAPGSWSAVRAVRRGVCGGVLARGARGATRAYAECRARRWKRRWSTCPSAPCACCYTEQVMGDVERVMVEASTSGQKRAVPGHPSAIGAAERGGGCSLGDRVDGPWCSARQSVLAQAQERVLGERGVSYSQESVERQRGWMNNANERGWRLLLATEGVGGGWRRDS